MTMRGDQGWAGYYDAATDEPMSGIEWSGIHGIGDLHPGSAYKLNLTPTGSGKAYYPGSVDADAEALNYLGYQAGFPGGGNGQAADIQAGEGAWDDTFQQAVRNFQADARGAAGTVDGWIGVNTRKALFAAVQARNASNPSAPLPAPSRTLPNVAPAPSPSPSPAPKPGGLAPAPAASIGGGMTTNQKVMIGAGLALVLAGLAYVASK